MHLQSHWWNHYHECAIIVSRNIRLRMESKWAVLCVSALGNTMNSGEMERYGVCEWAALKQWNVELQIERAQQAASEMCSLCTVHTQAAILSVLQFIPTTFVFHEQTLKMHVYKSIDLCSQWRWYSCLILQLLRATNFDDFPYEAYERIVHIFAHIYIASPLILRCKIIAHIVDCFCWIYCIPFSIHMQNERWLWLFCSAHPHSMKSIVYLTFNI